MILQLSPTQRIRSDDAGLCYALERLSKNGKNWTADGYYPTIEQAAVTVLQRAPHLVDDPVGLQDLIRAVNRCTERLIVAVNRPPDVEVDASLLDELFEVTDE